ncbi:PaaI family thioesterase [Sphingomonas sp. R86520]|uniref:PaaI family thioesterase n=1 Tax=Sphingomonas sp. R86520 TaxID=3093859 RepID=UPI0036D4102C
MQPEPASAGAEAHYRALESLYAQAPINRFFESSLEIPEAGIARIHFTIDERYYHAGGAAHGTSYFKMLDDAAFYAANSLVTDRFLLTTAFNLLLTRPLKVGPVIAEGRWISGKRRVFVADARLIDADGEEAARGTGTFMRSRIALAGLPGYRIPA